MQDSSSNSSAAALRAQLSCAAAREFQSACETVGKAVASAFPEHATVVDCSTINADALLELAQSFLQHPVPADVKVPYRAALQRLLPSHTLTCGDLAYYMDVISMRNAAMSWPMYNAAQWDGFLAAVSDAAPEKSEMVQLAMNELRSRALPRGTQTPPSRDDLARNIEEHRQRKRAHQAEGGGAARASGAPKATVDTALFSAIGEFACAFATCAKLAPQAAAQYSGMALASPSPAHQAVREAWLTALRDRTSEAALSAVIQRQDFAALIDAHASSIDALGTFDLARDRAAVQASYDEASDDERSALWDAASKIASFAHVQASMPASVLSSIEQAAGNLVQRMQDGTLDMDALDLNQIGDDVLNKCSERDVTSVTRNLKDVLPSVLNLSKASSAGAGAAANGVNLQALAAAAMGGGSL